MRPSVQRIKIAAAVLAGVVASSWSSFAAAQCSGLCITWESDGGWDGTFSDPGGGNLGTNGGNLNVDGQHVRPVVSNSQGAIRGSQAVGNLSVSPPPPADFSVAPPDTSSQGTSLGMSLAPHVSGTPGGQSTTVPISSTIPSCATGPNPTCSGGGNLPVPVATGPAVHPNLADNVKAVPSSDPVNPANGEFVAHYTDLSFPGFGVSFAHVRTYRSRVDYDGPLGFGWDHAYNQRIIPGDPNQCSEGVLYTAGDGSVIRFEVTATGFAAPEGVPLKLEQTDDGWNITHPEGIVSRFRELPDGSGVLTSIKDLNGKGITFTWTIADPGPKWRLTNAEDSVGRLITYDYYPDGHLKSVSNGVLVARYDYDGNELHHAITADLAEETYTYKHGFPDFDRGDALPAGQVAAACQKACSASPGCGAADPCVAVADAERARCHQACPACNTACQAQCPTLARDACQASNETGQCLSSCKASHCQPQQLNQICSDAFAGRNKTGPGPTPDAYCHGCEGAARASCGFYCSELSKCTQLAMGAGLTGGVVAGIYSGGAAAAKTAIAAYVGTLLLCLKGSNIPLNWDTAERLAEVQLVQSGFIVVSAVADTGECIGTAVADGFCGGLSYLGVDACDVDTDCNYSRTTHAVSLFCEDDCFLCNAHGEHCGSGSCNDGHECYDDCKAKFFGNAIGGSCPEYGAAGGGCPAKALSSCNTQCNNACTGNCTQQATTVCQDSCQSACAPSNGPAGLSCDQGCDAVDLITECRGGCVENCIATNNHPSGGLRYGGLRELNHNLTKIVDGGGNDVVVNTYGEDPTHPSFDSVISQTNGDFGLQFRYRDIGAEQRGQRPVPTDPQELEGVFPSMTVPTLCPTTCIPVGPNALCFKTNAALLPKFKAERATAVTDAYGVPRTYYFGAFGEVLARHDLADDEVWTFNYEGGLLRGVHAPAGDQQCFRRDAAGNLTELMQFPTPGSVSDNSTTLFMATARVFKWGYQSSPSRLTEVFDPRRQFGSLRSFRWDPNGNLTETIDGNGVSTRFVPTSFGPPDTATLPDGSVTKFVYDTLAGTLKSVIRDSEGATPVTVNLDSDLLGRPSVSTGILGETTTWQWNGAKIDSITRHANGFLDEVTTFQVDNNGRVFNTNNGQLSVTTKFDRLGFAQSTTAVANDQSAPRRVTCTRRGPDGRLLEEVLPRGNRIRYTYDGAARLTLVTKGFLPADPGSWDDDCPTLATGETSQMWFGTYGADGTLDSVKDAQGTTTTILAKTGFGEAAAIREQNGRITHFGYDPLGNVVWQAAYACGFDEPCTTLPAYAKPAAGGDGTFGSAGLSRMTELSYDNAGTLTATDAWHFDPRTRLPLSDGHSKTSYVRVASTNELIITDDAGKMTIHRTDRAGRPTEIALPTGDVIKTEYANGGATLYRSWPTPAGLLAERTLLTPWGAPAERALLEGADPIAQRPARPVQVLTYDGHRRHTGGIDVGVASSTIVYDAFGQPASQTREFGDGVTERAVHTFNDNGLLQTIDSQAGATTPDTHVVIGYDLLDRVTSVDKGTVQANDHAGYRYEAGSNLVRFFTDARGVETQYVRWSGGAVRSAVAVPPPTAPGPMWVRSFTYDGAGRMLTGRTYDTLTTFDHTVTFRWDSLDNKNSELSSLFGETARVKHRFDGLGRRELTSIGPEFAPVFNVTRIHDAMGRLTDVSAQHSLFGVSGQAHFDNVGLGKSGRVDDVMSLTTVYNYDTFGRLTGSTLARPGLRVGEWKWKSPLDGIPREATFTNDGGVVRSSVYQVDRAGRLSAEANGIAGEPLLALSPSASTPEGNNAVDEFIDGSPHRRLSLDGRGNWISRLSTDGSTSSTTIRNTLDQYTSFGNRTNHYDGGALSQIDDQLGTEFKYDGFGQLLSVGPPLDKVAYRYDALGRLISRTAGGSTDTFAYDGAERTIQHSASRSFSYTVDGAGMDEHVLRYANGRIEHMHQDRMGSVYLVTTGNGTPLERYAYTAYGERTITNAAGGALSESAIGNDLGFQGQRHDARTGMIEMRHRWYRPDWGRFISADPLGIAGGPNAYAFGAGAPLMFTDPFGLSPQVVPRAESMSASFWRAGGSFFPGHLGYAMRTPPGGGLGLSGEAIQTALNASGSAGRNSGAAVLGGGMVVSGGMAAGAAAVAAAPEAGWAAYVYVSTVNPGLIEGVGAAGTAIGLSMAGMNGGTGQEAIYGIMVQPTRAIAGAGPVLKGQAGVRLMVEELEARGVNVQGQQIHLYAPNKAGGAVIPDALGNVPAPGFKLPDGQFVPPGQVFFDAKNGPGAGLTAGQIIRYPIVRTTGAVPFGANAAGAGLPVGTPIGPTPVIIYPVNTGTIGATPPPFLHFQFLSLPFIQLPLLTLPSGGQ